ncbi:centromere protein J isoform X1 [Gambusia affinis]|uniref:centromere protein J isoform X1 n=1 Tax=Gambusia affinis TaxID=33528 RepID=UPI001CDBB6F4|nr:centromere protein J isoform X1 [Gambusia affinis]XP_043987761.1 centromere protein J isoform X1 [Gambusia affinis]XP_043987762.1 centromere protein J isoform X1 [Gambusia affinis]
MSSPSELQFSSADFLTKWMPSSTRAGVILSPPPELAGSLRNTAAAVPAPLHPDDSFVSDFAPLPASTDSSCLGVDGCGEGTRPVSYLRPAPQGISDGHFENLGETTSKTQDLPLMMKLEELKKWQQHMHEQLKAHQLEELLCLQEQQHRLLGVGDVPRICTEGAIENPGLPGAQWRKDTVQRSPDRNCGLPQELQLSDQQEHEDDEGMWDSDKENPKQSLELDDAFMQPDANSRQQEKDLHDKPIKPGIGGQKKTFEELLEEQLRLEEERLKSAQQQPKPARPEAAFPAKRPFLKRGQGLSRFTSSSKASAQKAKDKKEQKPQAITRSNAAPGPILKGGSCAGQALPVQRKTAVLNKENRGRGVRSPPQDIRAESRAARTTTVLGSHQRQNTGPAASQTAPEPRPVKHLLGPEKDYNTGVPVQVVRNTGPNLQPNPVIKQVGLSGDAGKEKSCVSKAQSAGAGGGLPWDSFELSFQEKLQRWECNRHLESVELGEFELLEQAAEELSFSSNSSFVMKVLCLDQQKRHSAIGLHQRRLSSTPIKSASGSEPQKGGGVRLADGSERERISLESVASGGNMRGNALKNEVTEGGREPEAPRNDEISEFGGKEVTVCFSAPPNPAYDKRSYQDEESFRDEVEEDEDEESDSVASNADGSTLTEDGHDGQRKVIFDDDDTWNDLDDTAVTAESDSRGISPVPKPTAGRVSPQEKAMLRKVAVSRAVEPDEGPETEPAPASQLMTRLFPSLKPKAQSAPPPAPPAPSENRKQDDTAQQVQSRQLRERLAELEMEIERFKKENTALTKLRQENERRQEDLRKELLMFEQAKAEELANFEEYKREENRKLQKERKLFEKHVSAARAIPDKKEREEIQLLKQQLSSQQEELKRRESRWASTHGRLRQQIDSLHQENAALRDEIRTLEKLRLSAWRKSSASAEKGVQTKDGPRVSDSSVAKGVTFATPLDSRGSGSSPPLSSAGRKSKDNSQAATAGMKSSLRRSAGSGSSLSSSTTFSGRRTEEKPRPTSRSQEKPPNQKLEHPHHCSPRIDLEPEQPESCEARDPEPPQEVITHPDGKVEKVLAGGDRVIVFPNGTRKEVSADGLSAKVTFFNGDTKQITADQRVIYHYAEAQTTHITYPDGMEVLHFPNNQTEKHFPDGRKEITFPDQTVKNLFPDGREESVLTDGTIIQVNPDGTKEIHFNTGQKETHTAEYKRREYPDGTVKTVYTDGRQETRYPTGRLRVKDKDGNVVLDNRV